MGKKKKKKLGSVSDVESKDSTPFWDQIWDYKPYIIVGAIIIALLLGYFLIIRNLHRNPEVQMSKPEVSPTKKLKYKGTLFVTTEPAGALVSFRGKVKRAPAKFVNIPEGEFKMLLSRPNYKTMEKNVKFKKGEQKKLTVKMEK